MTFFFKLQALLYCLVPGERLIYFALFYSREV